MHTCTKAVAIRTPVPKCFVKKNTFGGMCIHVTFFATTGKPQPPILATNTMTDHVSKAISMVETLLTNSRNVKRHVITIGTLGALASGFRHL
jgi:hypothetical protein